MALVAREPTRLNRSSVQVLRFCAFFQERVPDSPEERWRVRKCQVLHYLEDGSTQVEEPHEDNSGLRQGTLLRRHRCGNVRACSCANSSEFNIAMVRLGGAQEVVRHTTSRRQRSHLHR